MWLKAASRKGGEILASLFEGGNMCEVMLFSGGGGRGGGGGLVRYIQFVSEGSTFSRIFFHQTGQTFESVSLKTKRNSPSSPPLQASWRNPHQTNLNRQQAHRDIRVKEGGE